jgi:hypothetical protein
VKKETGENWRYLKVRQIDFAAFTKEHPHGSFQKFLDWLEKRDQQQSVLVLG